MATYYKYAEREADSYVDWGAIGKSMSDMLLEKDKIRNEKRAALDEASRQFGEVLANAPQGEHVGARQQALEYANNAAQFMRMQDILLKSGQLNLRDYTIARQNILDDTDRAFKANEMYQKVYKEKMDRYKKDISQAYELRSMERVEGFGNFSQSGFWINPATGKVSVAMKELKNINGQDVYVMAENPNNMTSIDAINGLILGQWDRYDSEAATTALAEMNGKQIQSMMSSGAITKVEDILKKPDYINAETNYINAALGGADSFDRVSLLTDSMIAAPNGKQYRFTNDEADAQANPEAILMKIDPASGQEIPQISDEQMKDSTEWMRTRARSKYDYEKTITQKQQRMYDKNAADASRQNQEREQLLNAWKLLRSGNLQEKAAALEYLNGSPFLKEQGLGSIGFNADGTGVIFQYVDKDGRPLNAIEKPLKVSGTNLSGSDWMMSGSEAFGNLTEAEIKKHSGGDYEFNEAQKGMTAKRTFTPQAATTTGNITPDQAKAMAKTDTATISQSIIVDDPDTTVTNLEAKYGKYGFTFTPSPGAVDDEVIITPLGGGEPKAFNIDDLGDAPNIAAFIVQNSTSAFMNAQTPGAGDGIFEPQ
jgi:hypothetical protein